MGKNELAVSVVIPAFNSESTIEKLLANLSSQTLRSDRYEIIVVDDGSKDRTLEIVRRFSAVKVIEQPHRGPGAARMIGTRNAKGSYVLYLDSDVDVSHDLIEKHLVYHLAHPEVSVTGGGVLPEGRPSLFSWAMVDYLSSWFNAHPKLLYRQPPEYLPSLNFFINRKRVIDKHEVNWEDGLSHSGEDVIFCYRLRERGLAIAFVPEAIVRHRDRKTCKGYLRHMYRWGHHAPFVRGTIRGLKYSFLFPRHVTSLIFTLPIIIIGYTCLLWKSWIWTRPVEITFCLPQILLGRLAYAWGVLRGTIERNGLLFKGRELN